MSWTFIGNTIVNRRGGGQSWSSYWTTHDCSNVDATVISDTVITVTWTDGASAPDGYRVYVNDVEDQTVAHGVGTADITGLTADTEYTIKVVAYKGDNESTGGSDTVSTILKPTAGWYDSVSVTNASGKASAVNDKSGNVRHLLQADADLQPVIEADEQNGYPALVYDGINDRNVLAGFTINQPITIFIAAKLTAYDDDGALFGGTTSTYAAAPWFTTADKRIGVYAGSATGCRSAANVQTLNAALYYRALIKDNAGELIVSDIASVSGDCGANTLKGFELGGYANADAGCSAYKFYEALIYAGELTAPQTANIKSYLDKKYNLIYDDIFDGVFTNSVEYTDKTTYKIRSAHSQFKFNYSGTTIFVKAVSTLAAVYPTYSYISVFINGVYNQRFQVLTTDVGYQKITLPAGDKELMFIEPLVSRINDAGDILGVFITGILGEVNFTNIAPANVAEKLVFLGDSIVVGGNADNPSSEGFPNLFMIENDKEVVILGWGYAGMDSFGSSAGLITAAVGYITSAFSNVTTTKKLIISLGTNDYAVKGITANNFETYYGDLLDAIHLADADIQIWCISPILRGDAKEDATLDDFRSRVADVCTARPSYCTHITGKTILSYPADYDDAVHPDTDGHKKLKDALYAILYP